MVCGVAVSELVYIYIYIYYIYYILTVWRRWRVYRRVEQRVMGKGEEGGRGEG